ncbi:MAG: circularly permuted type 2 ATP-grasp protein, partial [Gammaproteobacteria bacterium]
MKFSWKHYDPDGFYDELISSPGYPRTAGRPVARHIRSLTTEEIRERQMAAEIAVKTMGITFTVYSQGTNIDRAWPYDIIPRTISGKDWDRVEAGLIQRFTALNRFIDDIYNDQKIFKDGIVPPELILESTNYRAACAGMKPKFGAWAHICGSDLIRDRDGTFYVLEDNLRVPSGVSYMLENRKVTKRVFPELFEEENMRPIGEYTSHLFDTLASLSPRKLDYPEVVVLTPGIYNSAYFEHSYLAQQMGAELVEGSDLFVADDDCVYMRTISGPARVDVIYRRIDDLFFDPEVFNPDSALGVPGLM